MFGLDLKLDDIGGSVRILHILIFRCYPYRHSGFDPAYSVVIRHDHRLFQAALVPGDVDRIPSASAQTLDGTARPCSRQRRQQMQGTGMALQQHLRDPGRTAKVAVNLERRVVVKQDWAVWNMKQSEHVVIGLFRFLQPGPEQDDPGPAPAGMPAAMRQPVAPE